MADALLATAQEPNAEPKIGLRTLVAFLLGSREAVLRVGQSPTVPLVGLLFVVSAGFAREYDGQDLLHEPGHLLLPLAASLATSCLLYAWLWLERWSRGGLGTMTFARGYFQFLGWYWLTAPLAWLYAIPYEQFLSPLAAAQAHYATLGLVAIWRVALMIRIAHVAYGMTPVRATFFVLAFADVVAFVAIQMTPRPIADIMAGVRLNEEEQIAEITTLLGTLLVVASGAFLLFSCLGMLVAPAGDRRDPQRAIHPRTHVGRNVWFLAFVSTLIWLPILPYTQPAQQRRRQVEQMLRRGETDAALAYLSQFERTQLPAVFNPPPRLAYREEVPDLAMVALAARKSEVAQWVRDLFHTKWRLQGGFDGYYRNPYRAVSLTDEQLEALITLMEGETDGAEMAADLLRYSLTPRFGEPDVELPEQRQTLVDRVRRLAESTKTNEPYEEASSSRASPEEIDAAAERSKHLAPQ